jgi:hypothetical protein
MKSKASPPTDSAVSDCPATCNPGKSGGFEGVRPWRISRAATHAPIDGGRVRADDEHRHVEAASRRSQRLLIPNLRRNNFAVYEDGVRQQNVTVEVEHVPIALAVLVEMGGRSQQLNRVLANEASYVARPVLDVLGRDDKLALFT